MIDLIMLNERALVIKSPEVRFALNTYLNYSVSNIRIDKKQSNMKRKKIFKVDVEEHSYLIEDGTPFYSIPRGLAEILPEDEFNKLYERILWENGGIISECPPGSEPAAWHFPARNRIISALSDAVLVVEAKESSGSLITAGFALEQGKMVYAIPGAVTDVLSRGCHKLIYDGAGIAYCPEILLEELGISSSKVTQTEEKNNLGLATDLNMVYSCLDLRPKNPDYIVRKTGFSPAQVSNCLVELTLRGLIRECGRYYYVRSS